jgi:hypothetical protein
MDFRAMGASLVSLGREVGSAALTGTTKAITKANAAGVPDSAGVVIGQRASEGVHAMVERLLVKLPESSRGAVTEALTAGIGSGTSVGSEVLQRIAAQHVDDPTIVALVTSITDTASSAGTGVVAGRLNAGAEEIAKKIVPDVV